MKKAVFILLVLVLGIAAFYFNSRIPGIFDEVNSSDKQKFENIEEEVSLPSIEPRDSELGQLIYNYGERVRRYVHIEAGHAAQNALLMAENLGLNGVVIGAFDDDEVQEIIDGIAETPLIIIPLGYKR